MRGTVRTAVGLLPRTRPLDAEMPAIRRTGWVLLAHCHGSRSDPGEYERPSLAGSGMDSDRVNQGTVTPEFIDVGMLRQKHS
jgi:hypothetical protein